MSTDFWPEVAMKGDETWGRSGLDNYLNTGSEKILRECGITRVVMVGSASHSAVLYTAGSRRGCAGQAGP